MDEICLYNVPLKINGYVSKFDIATDKACFSPSISTYESK